MCGAREWMESPPPTSSSSTRRNFHQKQQQSSRRCKVRVQCLVVSKRRFEGSTKMTTTESLELKNLQLYLENRSILEENERLRQKAIRLRLENQALLSAYQTKIRSC